MSLFRPYQYKSRPDLRENGPVKNGFFMFFELYFRKFWRLLTVNLEYFAVTLPMLIYIFYVVNGLFADRLEALGEETVMLAGVGFIASLFSFIPKWLNAPLLVLSALLYGPVTMGMTYMLRNFAREEHAWGSDLWGRAWSNARQGIIFGLLDIVLVYLFINGMFGGIASAGKTAGFALSTILSVICAIALVIWMFMRHYTYLMAVTVNLNIISILKNAWLFTVLGFGRNVLSFVVTAACIVFSFLLAPLFTIITIPLFFYTFTWFCTVFTCYPIVKKYIIVPALEQSEPDGSGETGPEEKPALETTEETEE